MKSRSRTLFVLVILSVFACFLSVEALAASWANPVDGNWSDPTKWSDGVVPGPSDDVAITVEGTYTVTLDVDATVASLTLGASSGTQTLSGIGRTFTINAASTINNNGILSLTSSTLTGPGTLTNHGTMIIQDTTINVDLVNRGSLTARSTCDITGSFSSESGSTLRVEATGGDATLNMANSFTNNGTIELVNAGQLGQDVTLTVPGTLINAAGGNINVLYVSWGDGYINSQLDNRGTLTADCGLTINQPSAAHTNSGTINVNYGNLTLTQSGTAPSFVNTGTINLSGGNLTLTQSGTDPSFTNSGTIDIASGTLSVTGGTFNHNGVLTGSGTLSVSGSTFNLTPNLSSQLTLSLSSSVVNGPGTLTNQGTMIIQDTTINTDLVNEGSLTARSTCDINGSFSSESGSTLRVEATGGDATLNMANSFTNNGTIELAGQNIGQTWDVTLAVAGTLVNAAGGNINVLYVSRVYGGRYINTQLDNRGTLTLDYGLTINQPSAAHTNSGTINVNYGNLTLTQSGTDPSFTNSGTIDIASGTLSVTGGTFNHNGVLTGSGTLSVSGSTFNLTPNLSSQLTLSLSSSVVNGPGTLTNQGTMIIQDTTINTDLVNEGSLMARSTCSINGSFSSESGSTLRVEATGYVDATLNMADSFTNNGTIELVNAGQLGQDVTLTVPGTLINAAGGNINVLCVHYWGNGYINSRLDNQGTLTVDCGLTINQPSAAHTNSGTINVNVGVLTLTQSGTDPSFTNTGTIEIASGMTFAASGGTFENAIGGVIQGTGTLNVSGTSFTNAGDINPGTSPGILSITGNFPQELTGAVNIEFGGLDPGTEFDRLNISGSAAFAGALNVMLINSFHPSLDDIFQIVNYSSRTGIFSSTNLPVLTGDLDWDISYGNSSIVLRVILPITVYVDDDNEGGPWDGSESNPFNTIQKGVDFARPGDTVYISAGEYGESISIEKNIFLAGEGPEVTIIDGSGGDGPAVYCKNMARGKIEGFHIKNGINAGIQCEQSALSIRRNIVSNTSSGDGIKTGAGSSLTIENNIIHENDLSGIGFEGTAATIVNNTIVSNGDHGVSCLSGDGVVVNNNIIVSNGEYGISCDQLPEPQISYNNVWDNMVGDYSGCSSGTGDISGDPQFEDSVIYDFHITTGSPCIDAGTSDGVPEFDFDGNCRCDDPNTEPNTGGGTYTYYDMGVYEYFPACEGDFDSDGDVDGSDLAVFAVAFGSSSGGPDYNPDADFDDDGYVDESDLAMFAEHFGRTDCPICP